MAISVPRHPTHAVRFRDNFDGEGDLVYLFAFMIGDDFYNWEGGKPLLQYEGDEILASWVLS